MDLHFPGYHHVYGIPEHATSLALKSTTGRHVALPLGLRTIALSMVGGCLGGGKVSGLVGSRQIGRSAAIKQAAPAPAGRAHYSGTQVCRYPDGIAAIGGEGMVARWRLVCVAHLPLLGWGAV